jgi:hypothetical protein
MPYLLLFLAGAFLCNALPHLSAGLRGEPFPTPFARPRGVGLSSPLLNFYWGMANLVLALVILWRHPVVLGPNPELGAMLAGALLLGTYCSRHFGKVRALPGTPPKP